MLGGTMEGAPTRTEDRGSTWGLRFALGLGVALASLSAHAEDVLVVGIDCGAARADGARIEGEAKLLARVGAALSAPMQARVQVRCVEPRQLQAGQLPKRVDLGLTLTSSAATPRPDRAWIRAVGAPESARTKEMESALKSLFPEPESAPLKVRLEALEKVLSGAVGTQSCPEGTAPCNRHGIVGCCPGHER